MAKQQDITLKIDNFEKRSAKYIPVSAILSDVYGHLDWSRGQDGMDELISCILSQNTNDTNRDRGFQGLKDRFASWKEVQFADTSDVIRAIRSAGLANQKAPRIQNVLEKIYQEVGDYNVDFLVDLPIDEAKKWLISLKGVGPKTAAIVLCFAYGLPAFPVDTHVHRTGKRIGFLPEKISADHAHPVMEAIVPPEDYYQFHIHLIQHGRDTCRARNPACERCPLTDHCDYYQQSVKPETASKN
jgi:endonuclease III